MKKFVLFLLAFLCLELSLGQVTLNLSSTESTCENNGTITATAMGGVSPYTYTLTGPQNVTLGGFGAVTFLSLPAGMYTVLVSDNVGDTDIRNIDVTGTYMQPDLDTEAVMVSCTAGSDGSITATMTEGLVPYEYEIIAGPSTAPRSPVNIFPGLVAGVYTVRAYDACDNFQTRNVEIVENYSPVALINVGRTNGEKISCTQSRYEVAGNSGLAAYQYRIIAPADYATPYQASGEFFTPYDPSNRPVTFEVLDACGQTATLVKPAPTVRLNRQVTNQGCTGFNLAFSPNNMVEPISYEILAGPNGPQSVSDPNVGLVDYGAYTLQATDACGEIRTTSFTELYAAPVFDSYAESPAACVLGEATVVVSLDVPSNGNIVPNVVLTLNTFPADYSGPNSFTSNTSNSLYTLSPLVAGDYNVTIEDACGNSDNFDITVTQALTVDLQSTLTRGCVDDNTINSTATTNGFSPISAPWRLYELDTDVLVQGPLANGDFVNVPDGEYYVEFANCSSLPIRDTVIIDPYEQPKLAASAAITCNDASVSIAVEPEDGLAPFMYEIIDGPAGQTYPIGPQASSLFENLLPGTDYRVRISDACGNSSSTDVSVQTFVAAIITAGLSCDGEDFRLFVEKPLSDVTYVWTLPDGSMVNGTEVILPAISTANEGMYILDANLGICASDQASYELDLQDCTLPVTWLSFDAQLQNNGSVKLNWATASEENNDYFSVESSIDGISWREIGTVDGNGTTNQESFYAFTDENPTGINNYYRIKQTDFDGTFDFSEIQLVQILDEDSVFVYPNPAKNSVFVSYTLRVNEPVTVMVYDVNGRNVLTQEGVELTTGIDVSGLLSGAYLYVFSLNGEVLGSSKWIKR